MPQQIGNLQPLNLLIIRHFPTLKAAEHEVVERLSSAANALGWKTKIVDVDSTFDFKRIDQIEADSDVVLDIHYEYPKFFKAKSVGAFWTPTSFMKDWDLPYVWENQLSHDFIVHTDSKKVLELLQIYRPDESFNILNHSIPLEWTNWIREATRNEMPRAFYAGINWSKLSGRQGRHHEFFKLLDKENVLDIYGPKKVGHITPWKGFQSYRGEIPFDGRSILRKARESGISLVLSADQHLKEQIISSRLFEGLSAGNAIISDEHPFIKKYLGKNARYLNFHKGDEYASLQLLDYVEELRNEPSLLNELQSVSTSIFEEKFNLTNQLRRVVSGIIKTDASIPKLDVLVMGSSQTDLYSKLKDLGFPRIEFTNAKIYDLQDLETLARNLNLGNYLVLNPNSALLDGLVTRIDHLLGRMSTENTNIGVLATVIMTQDGKKFTPVIAPVLKSLPLNGLIISPKKKGGSSNFTIDNIPVLRVQELSDLQYIGSLVDTHQFLKNSGLSLQKQEHYFGSLRQQLNSYVNDQSGAASADIAEEIRRLPKGRKTTLVLALAASIPGIKPVALIAKWLYRKKH